MSDTVPLHYGVATPEQIAGKSGLEILQALIDGFLPRPPICEGMNFWLAEIGPGFAAFEGVPGPQHLNPLGTVHGGWGLTLIDSAGGCAAHTVLPAGVNYTTIETKGNFSRPITPKTGLVRAEGRVVSQTRQIISTEIRVLNAEGKVLAHGTSTLMVLNPPPKA